MKLLLSTSIILFAAGLSAQANADLVRVEMKGVVYENLIGGSMTGVQVGDPVRMRFNVDSDNFLNSPTFPTRGYRIIYDSFQFMVGSVSVGIVNPQPLGQTPFFVLRNNDPAVDGVFVSTNVDIPRGVAVDIAGITQQHYVDFLRTFTNGTAFPSLNILECQGDYALENLSVYNWTIGINENQIGAQYDYQSFSIHAIPEPGSLLVFGVALLVGATRRRCATI